MPKPPDEPREPARHDLTGHAGGTSSASASHLAMEHPLESAKPSKETWQDWIPSEPGWFGPTDEELITRDELLERVEELGVKIHPRTLQQLESQGLMPRPVRRWHDGAVRALYAPWVVDLAIRAQERRRGKWPLDKAQADVREAAKQAIFTYGMDKWGGRGIPMEFLIQLKELADRQTTRSGTAIPSAEIRFLDADGRPVATLHQSLEHLINKDGASTSPQE